MAIEADTGTPEVISAPISAPENISVPDANLLFTGDFSRAGHDLVLTGSDGAKMVLEDYFITDTPPALVSPEGAMLTGDVVTSLAGPMFPAQYAQAGGANSGDVPIGQVQTIEGSASVVRANGLTLQLKIGDPVFQGDVVLTGPGSKLGVSFIDGTVFSLSADARMVLNSLIFDPNGSNNSMLFSLVEGTFVFASGQIAPTGDMKIQTPVATMGIRGTAPTVSINSVTGQVKFSIVPDPGNEHVGTYTLYSLTTGEAIGTVNSVGSSWQLTGVDGTLTEIPKSEDDLLNDQSAINEITNVFTTAQNNANQQQPQGDPGDTTNSIPGAPPSSGLNTGQPGADGGNTPPPTNTPPPPEGDPAPPAPPPQGATNNTDDPPPTGGPTPPAPAPTGPNVITGTPNAETLTGTSGIDLIDGLGGGDIINALGGNDEITIGPGGGPDIVDAGTGNDTLIVSEDSGWVFDGGDGIDTIRVVGDLNIDTSTFTSEAVNIEIIDLNKTHDNVVTFSADDFQGVNAANALQFRGGETEGGGNDSLILTAELFGGSEGEFGYEGTPVAGAWVQASGVRVIDGIIFDVWEFTDGSQVFATAEVERGIEVETPTEALSAQIDGEVFLHGAFLELGVSVSGTLGTADPAPSGFHPTGGRSAISVVFDQDGFDAGGNPNSGDLTLPGSPEDSFTVGFSDGSGNHNFTNAERNGLTQIDTVTTNTSAGARLSALTSGVVGGLLAFTQNISFNEFDTFFTTKITLTNNSQSTVEDVRFLRSFDPDQDLDTQGTFSTQNDVLSNPDQDGGAAVVRALGPRSDVSVNLVSTDPDARASAFGFSNRDPFAANAFDNPVDPDGSTQDIAITMTFDFGDLAPGQSVTKTFYTSMNQHDPVTGLPIGTFGNDILIGSNGAESLDGSLGNDNIAGAGGNDMLTGGGGADRFLFVSLQDGIDTITDFDATQDLLDFSGLLDAVFDKQTDDIGNFVKATTDQQTGETTVAVDVDGLGGPAQFTDVAILQGVGAGVDIAVSVGDDDATVSSAVVV